MRRSVWRSTTAGCSRTPSPAHPRKRPIGVQTGELTPWKPILDAYALPQDDRTRSVRSQAAERTDARDLARLVDWDPAEIWGPIEPESTGPG